MTREEAIDIIRAERECVYRQGRTGECCRDDMGCGACDLVQEDTNIMKAYDMAIEALKEKADQEDQALKNLDHALKHGRVKTSLGPPDPKYFHAKLIVTDYSSHDCETHYKCPFCGEPYRSWSIKMNEVFTCKCGKKVWTD